jgi:hypothetical protein
VAAGLAALVAALAPLVVGKIENGDGEKSGDGEKGDGEPGKHG